MRCKTLFEMVGNVDYLAWLLLVLLCLLRIMASVGILAWRVFRASRLFRMSVAICLHCYVLALGCSALVQASSLLIEKVV